MRMLHSKDKDKCQVPHPQQDAMCFCPQYPSANPQNTCLVTYKKCRAAKQEEVAVRERRKPSGPPSHPITIHHQTKMQSA